MKWRALLSGGFTRRRTEVKASAAGPLIAWAGPGQARWTPRRYDRLADEGYRRNVIGYRCVRVIAQGAASVRWLLYDATGREFDRHPLLDLLARPNPLQGGAAMLESLYGYFLIAGNAYLEAVSAGDGAAPRELHALRPDRMKIVPGPTGLPAAYEYSVQGKKTVFPADPVTGASAILHLRGFNPLDDWYGMSPIEAAAYAVDQHNAAAAWNQALLQNSARPSGALVFAPNEGPASLSDQQFQRLKAEIDAQYGGPGNAGRPMLLEGGLDWQEMSLSPKDMDFSDARRQAARDVACAFGVPPMLVGVPGDATYANYREARLALWEDTILPFLDHVVDQLNNWLGPRYGQGPRLAYDVDRVNALGPRRAEAWARVQGADFLSANEKRAATGYGPIMGGDELSGRPVDAAKKAAAEHEHKYDPDQPRAPAGAPDGGQWVDDGGGDGGGKDPARPVSKEPPKDWATDSVKKHWDGWNDEVANLPDVNDQERRCYADTFAAEGGLKDHKDEHGNVLASSGIGAKLLKDPKFRKDFPDLADVKHPGELTIEQRVRIYRWYLDTQALHEAGNGVPGNRLLAEIKDYDSASALCDVLFREGGTGGAKLVRDAVNDTIKELPAEEVTRLNLGELNDVGVLKPKDFQTYEAITNAGHGHKLRNKLSNRRQDKQPREKLRNDYFRFAP